MQLFKQYDYQRNRITLTRGDKMLGHYLMFNGDCAQALEDYAKAFSVTVAEMQRYGDVPDAGFPISEEQKGLVLHARLVIDGTDIMCADSTDRSLAGSNMYITLTTMDAEMVKKAWDALEPKAEVYMPLTQTFFALAHGSLRDRYGVNWMFTVPAA
jgi:PhnB protein